MKPRVLRLLERLGLLGPAFRAYERLQTARAGRESAEPDDGLPLPPARLRVKVAWTGDAYWFLQSGRLAEQSIRAALARHGTAPEEAGALLDFGCGCGRVTRRWLGVRGVDVLGCDANEEAVDWCARNLPFARFEVNGLAPPLAYDDEAFGLVYALSVFTHLTEELQILWLRELWRVLQPGALLLLTTHGRAYLDRLDARERRVFEAGEVVVRWQDVAGTNLCSAYHSEQSLRRLTGDDFVFVEHVPEGASGNPRQDQTLLRRR